jgi:Zn-dependent protease with chaperone function
VDFFESQDQARKRTGRLVVLFALAVIAIAATLYALAVAVTGYGGQDPYTGAAIWQPRWLDPELMVQVALATLLVVGGASLFKMAQLRAGGGRIVAESLGGRLLHPNSGDAVERRILNVVEEMAIAAGTQVPPVYLLDAEGGINAFAAGFEPGDAVVAVTRGTAERLSRDELQGVVAHEFSHILNGDMRLNIRLMGVLYGILVIGMIGYFVMRSAMYAGLAGRRNDRNNAGLAMLVIGAALAAIGFLGTFFGNMIKASVSRQREFLADASAVQFTRNPDGIAGALKKIGGFEQGSILASPNAPEASHFFFASGLRGGLSALFATHPPLRERIRRIDPSFAPDAAAAAVPSAAPTAAPAAAFAAGAAPASREAAGARTGAPGAEDGRRDRAAADHAVQHIGSPRPEHVRYASRLLERLPGELLSAAHESYGARAVVYALLVDADPAVRAHQLEQLERRADPGVLAATHGLLPAVARLDRAAALPLVDLAMPALRELSPAQYTVFRENVTALVEADDRIDLFEWALQRVLLTHLAPEFERVRRPRVRHRSLRGLGPQLSVVLSTLAHVRPGAADHARRAFLAGARHLDAPVELLPRQHCGLAVLDAALLELADAAAPAKRDIVAACTEVVCADGTLDVHEAELLRAVADTLGCPMPPILPVAS